jgi:predicted amidohydrolase YtcJ
MSIIISKNIFTANDTSDDKNLSSANCLVIDEAGIIRHVGDAQDVAVRQAKSSGALEIDVGNRTILPSFIDGHMHLLMFGQSLGKLSLESCKTLEDIRSAIKGYAADHKDAPRILCRGWMHFMTKGKALASMLDDLDPRPIFIDSKDLHSTWCNSAALAELGVESLPNPTGGTIHRDENGKASGLLDESAATQYVWPHIAKIATMKDKVDCLRTGIKAYNAAGYTGVVEMAMDENAWQALQELRAQEQPTIRIAAHWLIQPSEDEVNLVAQVDRAIELYKQFNLDNSFDFRIAGIKVICDGVIDACTASLCEPYANGTNAESLWTPEMLRIVVQKADAAGLQCALHAIGDGAIKLAVNALRMYGTKGRRHRIEHLELASSEDAASLGELGITASIQAVHADPAILRAWPKLLGEHRCGRAFPYKDFLDGGATLALGSDSPTAPHLPLPNVYTAATRRSAREPQLTSTVNEHFALPLYNALSASSAGSAYSCFAESKTGKLMPGMKADFVIVDIDMVAENFLQARVCQTWFEGKMIFDIDN